MPLLEFSEREATLHRAIVLSFDLKGFSLFCNQPEPGVAIAVPALIKNVYDLLNQYFTRRSDWTPVGFETEPEPGKLPEPSLNKFTGDGGLLLWERPKEERFPQNFCNLVVANMRRFQQQVTEQLPAWEKNWGVGKMPKQLRMGISTGVVYALRPPHLITSLNAPCDYVGYCINLAVRLQDYCPEVGFLVHDRLRPELPRMERFLAVGMRGCQEEPVAMFSEDRGRAASGEFDRCFRPIGPK